MKNNRISQPPQKLRFFGLGKLLPYFKKQRGNFFALVFCTLLACTLSVVLPLFQQYAINTFILGGTLDSLGAFITLYVLAILLSSTSDYFGTYACCRGEMFILRDMRRDAFNHIQTLSVGFFNQVGVGKLHARIMSDTGNIGGVVTWGLYQAIWNVTYVIGAVLIMLSIDPLLALCVIALVPLIALLCAYFERKIAKLDRRVREVNSEITGGFNEGITGVATSKTLAVENSLDKDFRARTKTIKKLSQHRSHFHGLFFSIIAFASSVALALVLWYGGLITERGVMLIGTLALFMTYAQGIMEPIQWAVEELVELVTIKVNIERFTALMETQSQVIDSPEAVEKYGDCFNEKRENWEKIVGDVTFKDVFFKYPDGTEYVLENFNLSVPHGTTVAIVGETGAGKSTLVNLVCRFYEPTRGAVLIDGRDVRERSAQWLHSNIGYVLQTPHLFSGTIRENVAYGKPDATDEQIMDAIRAAGAEHIVEREKLGLDAIVGEDGGSLSTGEKQLLSFARAILVNPAIFVLDEATSSVDSITEASVQKAIEVLMENRTSFVIAHRLSTIRSADVILVVSDGKIVERGSHAELMKARGSYYDLYVKQFREQAV